MVDLVVIMVVNTALIVLLTTALYARRYKRVPPDQAMIVYGRPRGDRAYIVIGPGGGKFVLPIVEQTKFMSLAPQTVRFGVRGVTTRSGVPMTFDFVAQVRISLERTKLDRAALIWPSRTPTAIADMAEETLAACARSLCATMEVEQVIADLDGFGAKVREAASPVLGENGLEFLSVAVANFGDEVGYIDALRRLAEGKKRAADEMTDAAAQAFANDPARKARLTAILQHVASMSDEESRNLLADLEQAAAKKGPAQPPMKV